MDDNQIQALIISDTMPGGLTLPAHIEDTATVRLLGAMGGQRALDAFGRRHVSRGKRKGAPKRGRLPFADHDARALGAALAIAKGRQYEQHIYDMMSVPAEHAPTLRRWWHVCAEVVAVLAEAQAEGRQFENWQQVVAACEERSPALATAMDGEG
jgi:hypothetical protein